MAIPDVPFDLASPAVFTLPSRCRERDIGRILVHVEMAEEGRAAVKDYRAEDRRQLTINANRPIRGYCSTCRRLNDDRGSFSRSAHAQRLLKNRQEAVKDG